MNYAYAGRDLFLHREGYEYAECDSDDFLQSWLAYRRAAIKSLRAHAQSAPENRCDECAAQDLPTSATHRSLNGIFARLEQSPDDPAAIVELDSLIQKYEVFRRLYSSYDLQMRRTVNAPQAQLTDYLRFGDILADRAHGRNLKCLSTLLKLCDALCSVPTQCLNNRIAARIADLLDTELQLVDTLHGPAN